MSAALHTPGPWFWHPEAEDEDGEPAFFSIKTESGREVANTASGEFTTDIELRNARLIAATPELLDALLSVHAELVFFVGGLDKSDAEALAKRIYEIIAKVTGGAK